MQQIIKQTLQNTGGFAVLRKDPVKQSKPKQFKPKEGNEEPLNRRKIITLCGSTKFKKEYEHWNKHFTLKGYIVFSVGCFGREKGEPESKGDFVITKKQKALLIEIHAAKIMLSDGIFIINKDGYIGTHTAEQIGLAAQAGKTLVYLETPKVDNKKESKKAVKKISEVIVEATKLEQPEPEEDLDW